ncbi:MAG: hypothetical protein Ct9H90mP25_2840 [Gammaproteobacteria bacterium]|nr:MAG: hypothetical protein Ct9H90mP25_2840 [Gammaproteobacteria bacterium]
MRDEYADEIQQKTGLLLDPYFSATKFRWLLDNVPEARQKAEAGQLAIGNPRYLSIVEINRWQELFH